MSDPVETYGYATLDYVMAGVPDISLDAGRPSEDHVREWIRDGSALVDAALIAGGVNPEMLPSPVGLPWDPDPPTLETLQAKGYVSASVPYRLRRLVGILVVSRLYRARKLYERAETEDMVAQRELSLIRAYPRAVVPANRLLARTATIIETPDE